MAKKKQIRIRRKAYTRKDGTRVKATTYLMNDPGTAGRRARGSKAGPFKGTKAWITREGKLGGPGYTSKSQASRRQILGRAVGRYGYRSTLGSLQVLLRDTEIKGRKRQRIQADKRWLVAKYGGAGSFSRKR